MTDSLLKFENPDREINAVDYYKNEEYTLEIGDDFIYEADDMSDEEIIEWAKDHGYLEEEEGYEYENRDPDIESLRELKRTNEEEYPPTYATPSGRAFLFFERMVFPESIDLKVIDRLHPGNDWQGTIVKGFQSLINLQKHLYENGTKVNFKIQ